MKHLNFIIFLLALELFTMSSQGLPIGYSRGSNQEKLYLRERNMGKSLKTPLKINKRENLSVLNEMSLQMENRKTQNTEKCTYVDDPEKWFVKIYTIPDTRPQKWILHSVNKEMPFPKKIFSKSSKKLININREFKRCILHCEKDRLMLRCMPSTKKYAKVSRENWPLLLTTKFLQINESEKLKNSSLSSILPRGFPCSLEKKQKVNK